MKEILYTDILKKAWNSMTNQIGLFAALSAVAITGIWIVSVIPFLGMVLVGPAIMGYFKCVDQLRKGNSIDFKDFFWGFTNLNRMLHAVILNLVVTIGTAIGFILIVIPGIWFVVSVCMSNSLFLLWKEDGLAVIQKSIKLVEGRWWNIAGFLGVLAVVNFLGSLCFGVGLLVTLPLTIVSLLVTCEQLLSENDVIQAEVKSVEI